MLFFVEKKEPKILGFKNVDGERKQEMSHFRNTSKFNLKFSGK